MVTLSEEQSGGGWRGLGDGLNTGNEGESLAQAAGLTSKGWTGLHGGSGGPPPRPRRAEVRTSGDPKCEQGLGRGADAEG